MFVAIETFVKLKLELLSALSISVSFAKILIVIGEFSVVSTLSITAIGASFVPVIVTVTVFVLNALTGSVASSVTFTV